MPDNVLVIPGEDGSFRIEDDNRKEGDPLRLLGRFPTAKSLAEDYGRGILERRRRAAAFRELRAAWFSEAVESHPFGWEELDETIQRQNANTLLRAKYDQQTEAILLGKELAVAPRDEVDLQAGGD